MKELQQSTSYQGADPLTDEEMKIFLSSPNFTGYLPDDVWYSNCHLGRLVLRRKFAPLQ
ncbi:8060_t:CDS:2, partial [Gigaspora rosea]